MNLPISRIRRQRVRAQQKSAFRCARVSIRQPLPDDGPEVIAMNRSSKNLHRPWVYAALDEASWARYIQNLDERKYGFLICLRDTGAIAGVVNISEIVRGPFQSAYLGFYAAAAYSGHGYMTEGLELVLDRAFKGLKLHRLEANIQPANHRSIALVRRLGFRKEGFSPRYLKIGGRWRDHQRWAITVEDWRLPQLHPSLQSSGLRTSKLRLEL